VLAFPGVFRGLLDAQATGVTQEMLLAAAHALADVVTAGELGPYYIVPSVFHADVVPAVAAAVRDAAGGRPSMSEA
jgi:malate dehydrogenase (oxaloacetate-decarboxylating)